MTSKIKSPPSPPDGQAAGRPCPSWCDRQHPLEPGDNGFHHSRTVAEIHLSAADDVPAVKVRVSQYEPPAGDEPRDYPSQVELHGGANSGCVDLTLLTQAEAAQVAKGLQAAAICIRIEQTGHDLRRM